jgi:hypothetical protein
MENCRIRQEAGKAQVKQGSYDQGNPYDKESPDCVKTPFK